MNKELIKLVIEFLGDLSKLEKNICEIICNNADTVWYKVDKLMADEVDIKALIIDIEKYIGKLYPIHSIPKTGTTEIKEGCFTEVIKNKMEVELKKAKYRITQKPSPTVRFEYYAIQKKYWIGWITLKHKFSLKSAEAYLKSKTNPKIIYYE